MTRPIERRPRPRHVLEMVRRFENWPLALADRLSLLRRVRTLVYRVRDGGVRINLVAESNSSDVRIISELWSRRYYERHLPAELQDTEGAVVVDIGANRGYFVLRMARLLHAPRFHCFEPEARNAALFDANIALNRVPDVELHPCAVTPAPSGPVTLFTSDNPALHSTLGPENERRPGIDVRRYRDRTTVESIDITSALQAVLDRQGRIDILKIDTEGTEGDLIDAITDEHLRAVGYIVAEIEFTDVSAQRRRLEDTGFEVRSEPPLLYAWRRRDDPAVVDQVSRASRYSA